jgi:hypothetical protein
MEQWRTLMTWHHSVVAAATLATVLWTPGRKDEAVTWYAAAARTEPGQFRDTSRHGTPGLDGAERATASAGRLGPQSAGWK